MLFAGILCEIGIMVMNIVCGTSVEEIRILVCLYICCWL